jgi:hypothetical protein
MNHPPSASSETLCLDWSNMVQDLLGCQWKLWDTHYRFGMMIVESVLATSMPGQSMKLEEIRTTDAERLSQLQQLASERMKKGLPPPREIYELPYRERINWASFPSWARPTDPELFENCSHEG